MNAILTLKDEILKEICGGSLQQDNESVIHMLIEANKLGLLKDNIGQTLKSLNVDPNATIGSLKNPMILELDMKVDDAEKSLQFPF